MTAAITDKPLPSLAEWLGDGTRGDGFEAWVRTCLEIDLAAATPQDGATIRILQTMSIGAVEAMRRELDRGELDEMDIVLTMIRCLGVVAISQLIERAKDAAALRRIVEEQFAEGVRCTIAAALKQAARERERK